MAFDDRLKLFISENQRVLTVVLVVAGVLALVAAGYVFTTPTTQTVTEETDVQTFGSDVDASAMVTNSTALYDEGERLENRSTYFLSASPLMEFEMNTSVPEGQSVEVSQRLELDIIGVRDDQPFFRETRTLVRTNRTVQDGTASSEATLNVSDVGRTLAVYLEEAQPIGQFRLQLRMEVTYRTDTYEGTLRSSAPFVINQQAYYIDGSLAAEETESTLVERQVTQPPSPAEYGGLVVLALLLFGAAAAVTRIGRRADPEEYRTQIVHDQHEEWISRGQFPTDSQKQYISILTLEDLVDVAIDTNRRVIYDPQIDAYAVIDSSEIYYYALEEVQADEWLDI